MADEYGRYVSIVVLTIAAALGAWTAWACWRARRRGQPGGDAIVWAALAAVYVALSQTKAARVLGLLHGLGIWLRVVARRFGVYGNRRPYQIAATVAVAIVVVVVLAVGIVSFWQYIKRYRLAVGFTGLAVGFAMIRFISLHEVDAWNASMPWLRLVVDVVAAAGASWVALVRLRQLGAVARPWRPAGADLAGGGPPAQGT